MLVLAGAKPSAATSPTWGTLEIEVLNEDADCRDTLEIGLGHLTAGCSGALQELGCRTSEDGRRFEVNPQQLASFFESEISREDVQVLLYCPGFRIETREVALDRLPTRLELNLERLPRRQVRGKAVASDGRPVAGATLTVTYSLMEAGAYFGFTDGILPQIALGSLQTDDDGTFEAMLLDLTRDPWIDADRPVSLVRIEPPRDHDAGWDEILAGARLRLRALYSEDLRIRFELR